jgi:2-C-methyl-D-erythritol 4-phosphate cytidylyltransferase
VVAAAGSSRRYGSDKLAERIGEMTVLERTVAALRTALPEAPLTVAVAAHRMKTWRTKLEADAVVAGGGRRQDSVRRAAELAMNQGAQTIFIHDGARPLVHPGDVRRVVDALGDGDGAILCAEIPDTVKRLDDRGVVAATLDRDSLRLAQTPQVFRSSALRSAWPALDVTEDYSDEAAILEAAGFEIRCVAARHPNPKLTTPADLAVMRALAGVAP